MPYDSSHRSGKSMSYKSGQSISGKAAPSSDKSMSYAKTISSYGSVGKTYYEQEHGMKGGGMKKGNYPMNSRYDYK